MKITSLKTRKKPRALVLKLEPWADEWSLFYTDLWDVQLALDDMLAQLGFAAVRMAGSPALIKNFREQLQVTSLYVCDQAQFNREVKERIRDGQFVCGGLWYAEITINEIPTDCSFNTLLELYQVIDQIVIRQCGLIIGSKPATVPGLQGNA